MVLVLLLVLTALGAPWLAPQGPSEQRYADILQAPSGTHPFGTDNLGRDIFSRIVWGARISLAVALVAVLVGTLVGAMIGLVSGYAEGKTDALAQRLMDAWMAIPGIVLALAILAALGPGLFNLMLAIGLSQLPLSNRVIRAAVLANKHQMYIEAARATGCTTLRILARHLLPNVTAPIIVVATMTLGQAILAEAALSFLGVGVPPPAPAWGSMLGGDSRNYMLVAWWTAIFPGLAISLTVLAWNLFGDALRDVWDPRLRSTV